MTLFDDSGSEFTAAVESLGRSDVDFRILERRESRPRAALSTRGRVWHYPRATGRNGWWKNSLGAWRDNSCAARHRARRRSADCFRPGSTPPIGDRSGQAVRPQSTDAIGEPQAWADWLMPTGKHNLQVVLDELAAVRRIVAHPGGQSLTKIDLTAALSTKIAIGPEGGFTEAELAAAIGCRLANCRPRPANPARRNSGNSVGGRDCGAMTPRRSTAVARGGSACSAGT